MIAEFLILVLLPALLLVAAGWDLASYTIPNTIPAALAVGAVVIAFAVGMPLTNLGWHALAGAVALIAGFAMFAFGWVGGGDAKLFAAVALLLGGYDAVSYALVSAVLGGALTLGLLTMRQMPLPRFATQRWILRLHDPQQGVPYGAALAAGAFVLLPHTEIFRACMGG